MLYNNLVSLLWRIFSENIYDKILLIQGQLDLSLSFSNQIFFHHISTKLKFFYQSAICKPIFLEAQSNPFHIATDFAWKMFMFFEVYAAMPDFVNYWVLCKTSRTASRGFVFIEPLQTRRATMRYTVFVVPETDKIHQWLILWCLTKKFPTTLYLDQLNCFKSWNYFPQYFGGV